MGKVIELKFCDICHKPVVKKKCDLFYIWLFGKYLV